MRAYFTNKARNDINKMKDELEDRRSNMPEQLQEVGSGEILGERIDGLDDWVNDLESLDLSVEVVEPSDLEGEIEREDGESDEDYQARLSEAAEDRNESTLSDALSELQNCQGNL